MLLAEVHYVVAAGQLHFLKGRSDLFGMALPVLRDLLLRDDQPALHTDRGRAGQGLLLQGSKECDELCKARRALSNLQVHRRLGVRQLHLLVEHVGHLRHVGVATLVQHHHLLHLHILDVHKLLHHLLLHVVHSAFVLHLFLLRHKTNRF